jgi:hypothetical protein
MQPTRCYDSQSIYFNKNSLNVSGGSSAHHQELKLYVQLLVFVKLCCHPLLLAVMEKVWMYIQTSSIPTMTAAGGSIV